MLSGNQPGTTVQARRALSQDQHYSTCTTQSFLAFSASQPLCSTSPRTQIRPTRPSTHALCTARHPCAWGSELSASGVIFRRYREHTHSAVSSGTRPESAPILFCECLHLLSASAAMVITDHWASVGGLSLPYPNWATPPLTLSPCLSPASGRASNTVLSLLTCVCAGRVSFMCCGRSGTQRARSAWGVQNEFDLVHELPPAHRGQCRSSLLIHKGRSYAATTLAAVLLLRAGR